MHAIIAECFSQLTKELCAWLGKILPQLSDNWWQTHVLEQLSFQQVQIVEQYGITDLSRLDLAALLRILDRNWFEVSRVEPLPSGTRNFVKELQTIRNRWAHAGSNVVAHDDMFRDLDTMQRFATAIHANKDFINKVIEEKQNLTALQSPKKAEIKPAPAENSQDQGAEFQPGDIVCLRSDPAVEGAIVNVTTGIAENRYSVFISTGIKEYYASQLQAKQGSSATLSLTSLPQFYAHLSAIQIQHPGLSTLYSLNAARIDFIPYQFRPVLKFIRSDRPRLLIADGVGVGKTIEAGLILRELQARHDIKSVLIICPRPLVTERKWESEMKRFDERFTQLDGKTLRYCLSETDLEGEWPDQHAKTIIPYSLFDETLLQGNATSAGRRKKKVQGLLELNPPPRFDLVIVDETHHIKNPNTFAHKGVRFFCDNAEAVVFLTATPIMLGSHDLFTQLNILRPDIVIDEEAFDHMAAPNPPKKPERRKRKTQERINDAPRKQKKKKERSVNTSKIEIDARSYLRNLYTNPDGVLMCQLCHDPMPFKKRGGDYYMNAVEIAGCYSLEVEELYLALCPNCSAKYSYFIKQDDQTQQQIIAEIRQTDAVSITLSLGKTNETLRFVETHLFDLKTILEQLEAEQRMLY